MTAPLPPKLRAFGITLERDAESEAPWYGGGKDDVYVRCWRQSAGDWLANISISRVTIEPDMTSSSPAAALRNLRGHARLLAGALAKAGIKP